MDVYGAGVLEGRSEKGLTQGQPELHLPTTQIMVSKTHIVSTVRSLPLGFPESCLEFSAGYFVIAGAMAHWRHTGGGFSGAGPGAAVRKHTNKVGHRKDGVSADSAGVVV